MTSDREERIEDYHNWTVRELSERVVELEDKVKWFKPLLDSLSRANVDLVKQVKELDPSRLESALRMYVAELDYDIHKNIQCGEEDGLNHYPEEVEFFLRCWETAGEG